METVGKFEFSRKDLIGHGAFAVVFKGRHREKHDWEVAVKCINKKNLSKSQTLLGKEIKILKVMLNVTLFPGTYNILACTFPGVAAKGTLSEDTIRVFLQQIAGAMQVLHGKGIIHRDLKPQNILLSYPPGRKSHSNNTCIKIADFGFARYLQTNMMAATLCGSPMYMAPEVIMSQHYDAKADLWSIGTIVFQCLTGKAPFQVNPTFVSLFVCVFPSIPRETSSHLRVLLLALLQRNHKDRLDFGTSNPLISLPRIVFLPFGGGICVVCLTASPQLSLAEGQPPRPKTLASPTQDAAGFLKDSSGGAGSSKNSSSCDTDDFVMVPAQFFIYLLYSSPLSVSSMLASAGLCVQARTPPHSPSYSTSPNPCSPSNYGGHHGNRGQSVPIPVPTQVHNYQRMEENLSSPRTDISPRLSSPVHRCGSGGSLGFFRMGPPSPSSHGPHPPNSSTPRRQSIGGAKTLPLIPHAFQSTEPKPAPQQQESGLGTRLHSAPCLLECAGGGGVRQKVRKQHSDPVMTPQPLHPSPRISPLPTILGSPSRTIPPFEFLNSPSGSPNLVTFLTQQGLVLGPAPPELPATAHRTAPRPPYQDPRAPPGCGGAPGGPAQVVFTVGSPPSSSTPPQTLRHRKYSGSPSSVSPAGSFSRLYAHAGTCVDGLQGSSCPRYGPADPIAANMGGPVSFEAPELPEETLMEQEHTDTLQSLRFTLDFCRCLLEVAGARGSSEADGDRGSGGALDRGNSILQQQSLVADQISSFSREWSYAEQLVLYLKAAELLSSALHMAMEQVKQGKLYPSTTVKQVVRHLNELYKSSVGSCRGLSGRLEHFFSRKHLLMDHVSCIRAERLLFSHTVHMVKAAALDEMFQQGASSAMRYHKALLLMEGLTLLLTEQDDILSVSKCKECIERRLTALQSGLCA
uniref:non-specific serine/threonine protein kinase n=1 Tax=Gadus morhua TaxID=8049 RepID=A0A8C4Z6U8_GADMO